MKVVRTDNLDRDDWHGDQYVVPGTEGMSEEAAKLLAGWITGYYGFVHDDFFVAKPNDYVLPPKWEP
jgi:hypothetical protein